MINLVYILILSVAFPAGYLVAYLARDELAAGRRYFISVAIASIIAIIPASFLFQEKIPVILTLFFIAIMSLISTFKSYDNRWTRAR